ncbi:MAG: hypothetical protein ACI88H_001292 [Cocleimonas sp.]|jgi:hypothetical protein
MCDIYLTILTSNLIKIIQSNAFQFVVSLILLNVVIWLLFNKPRRFFKQNKINLVSPLFHKNHSIKQNLFILWCKIFKPFLARDRNNFFVLCAFLNSILVASSTFLDLNSVIRSIALSIIAGSIFHYLIVIRENEKKKLLEARKIYNYARTVESIDELMFSVFKYEGFDVKYKVAKSNRKDVSSEFIMKMNKPIGRREDGRMFFLEHYENSFATITFDEKISGKEFLFKTLEIEALCIKRILDIEPSQFTDLVHISQNLMSHNSVFRTTRNWDEHGLLADHMMTRQNFAREYADTARNYIGAHCCTYLK